LFGDSVSFLYLDFGQGRYLHCGLCYSLSTSFGDFAYLKEVVPKTAARSLQTAARTAGQL